VDTSTVPASTLPKPLLGTHDVARVLGVTPNTARRLMLPGDIPARRIGGLWRVRPQDIDHMFDASEAKPTSPATSQGRN